MLFHLHEADPCVEEFVLPFLQPFYHQTLPMRLEKCRTRLESFHFREAINKNTNLTDTSIEGNHIRLDF